MVALRSARLESLLGSSIEQVEYSQLMTLISNQVPEAFDLDYKSEMYGSSDKDKRDAATDVAALANTSGGLLIIGIDEDDQARAETAPGVILSDADERRIRQIVGSQVVPMPLIDFLRAEDPGQPGHGLVLIAVPRSPLAPHAVLVNEGLRYPRRNGATTRYLSEPEVAEAYRQRFTSAHRVIDRATEIEAEALERLATTDDQVWIVVSLVPELAGEMIIDHSALRKAKAELFGKQPLILPTSLAWMRINIGRRRILADGTSDSGRRARYLSADLYDDGSGVFSSHVLQRSAQPTGPNTGEPVARMVNDESVVNGILSGLRFLARHAQDRAAAGGNSIIRAQIFPVGSQQPLMLGQNRMGFTDILGTRVMMDTRPSERVAPLDGLASGGRELVSATYLLATDVFQEFGCAEAAQLTRDGDVRSPYWGQGWVPYLAEWASEAGVEATGDTLPG
jgi:hypothetical protein